MHLRYLIIFIHILCLPNIFLAINEFYFLRHGQTNFNIKKEKINWDMPLNDIGKLEVKSLEKIVKNLSIQLIFFSPLKRTTQTKNILNQYLQVPEIPLPEIKEVPEELFSLLVKLKNHKISVYPKKLKKFLNRVKMGITKVLEYPELSLVVGHEGIYIAICYILDVKTKIQPIHNATLVHFYQKNNIWMVDLINDASLNILLI